MLIGKNKRINSFLSSLLWLFLFLCLVIFIPNPSDNLDIWYHIASGNFFLTHGIIYHDVFSFTEYGNRWIPYEWLAAISFAFLYKIGGFFTIKIFVALFTTLQIVIFYKIIHNIFRLSFLYSLFLTITFFLFNSFFFVPRPYIIANTLFIIFLYVILNYLLNNKNLLWIIIPLFFIWTNVHGSGILGIGLFLITTIGCFLYWLFSKSSRSLQKSKILFIFTGVLFIISILPPLGFLDYQQLWLFMEHKQLISSMIDEWHPLYNSEIILLGILFSFFSGIIILFSAYSLKKNKMFLYYCSILLGLLVFTYQAVRNVFVGSSLLLLLLAYVFTYKKKLQYFILGMITLIASVWASVLYTRFLNYQLYYPIQAASFITKNKLPGHIFNDFTYGSYLLSKLYPQQKVFIDVRVDVYITKELPDLYKLYNNAKQIPTKQFNTVLNNFFDKYQINYVLIRTQKDTVQWKIYNTLQTDPRWKLIFWDDVSVIFIRNSTKNNSIIRRFGASVSTPFLDTPYQEGKDTQAFMEYNRMIQYANSGVSQNAIGTLLLKQKQIDNAKKHFLEAVKLNPHFDSPYLNLGEIAAYQNDYQSAIDYYKKGITLAPETLFSYVRLGQFYLQGYQDKENAKTQWEKALSLTEDVTTRTKIQSMIDSLEQTQ